MIAINELYLVKLKCILSYNKYTPQLLLKVVSDKKEKIILKYF